MIALIESLKDFFFPQLDGSLKCCKVLSLKSVVGKYSRTSHIQPSVIQLLCSSGHPVFIGFLTELTTITIENVHIQSRLGPIRVQ